MPNQTAKTVLSQDEILDAEAELKELLSSIDAFMDLASNGVGPDASISVKSLSSMLKLLREKTQSVIDVLS